MTVAQALIDELAGDPQALDRLRELLGAAEAERLLKADEAADRLGIHPKTLTRAARAGRVRGAILVGERSWRFRAGELELLPPAPSDVGPAGAGRAARRPGASSATLAIRGDRKAA